MDDLSLGLIHYLLQAAAASGNPLIVIAAARPSPAAAAFAAGVDALLPADRRAHIELGPLGLEEGVSLVHALDAMVGDAEAAELWRRAQGSPFWLQSLALSGPSADPSGLIQERFRVMSGDAAALLAALAIGGRPLSGDDLGWVLEWHAERVRQAARELVSGGLAVEAAGTLRTAHDLIREAAQRDVASSTSGQLHGRLAALIERDAGNDVRLLREALEHRMAAGMVAADLALRMVTSTQRRLLGKDGLRLLAAIADGTEAGSAEQIRLDTALGELAGILGEQRLAMERWNRVSEFGTDLRLRQRAELEAARAAFVARERQQAHLHLVRARNIAVAEPETIVRLDTLEADVSLWLDHDTAAGSRAAERAIVAAEDMATRAGGADRLPGAMRATYLAALHTATDAAMQEDRGSDVIRLAEIALHHARRLDEEPRVGALLRIGFTLMPFGRLGEAEAILRKAWDVATRLAMPTAMVEAGNGLARVLPALGRFDEARAVALQTLDIESRLGNAPRRWGAASPWLHAIELSVGDPAAAIRALRHDAETEVDPHFRLRIRQNIAAWEARFGGATMADAVALDLDAARADAEDAACPRCTSELEVTSAELLARIGRVEDAKRQLGDWETRSTAAEYPMREVRRARAAAAIAAADLDPRDAAAILEAWCEELRSAGLLEELLWARLDLGRLLAGVDRSAAAHAFTRAATLAGELGARTQGRLAAQQLRLLGVRAWRRGPASAGTGIDGLTLREVEVARLAAAGTSNQEIASLLAISPRTVERHITNVLTKLGLRNRTELAGVVHSTTAVRDSPDDRTGARS